MAYTEFSTERADYILHLGAHFTRTNPTVFQGIDALVLESCRRPLDNSYFTRADIQYSMLIKYCEDKEIPIFVADVPYTHIGYWRGVISMIPQIPALLVFAYYNRKTNALQKVNTLLEMLYDGYTFVLQEPLIEGRNALNARKIEEHVVQSIIGISGKDHPKIGLEFGLAHMGLRFNLKSKKRRDFTIWNWRNLNFGRYSGFNKEELNKVYEARYADERWQVIERQTDLF